MLHFGGGATSRIVRICVLVCLLGVAVFGVDRSVQQLQEAHRLQVQEHEIEQLFDHLPMARSGRQTDALEAEQLAAVDRQLTQFERFPATVGLLRANIALRLGNYHQVEQLLPEELSQPGLLLQGNAHLLHAYELLQLGSGETEQIVQLAGRAQDYFMLAGSFPRQQIAQGRIVANRQFAQLLEYYVRLREILEQFTELFDRFTATSQEHHQVGELISRVMHELKAWELPADEEARTCADRLLNAGRSTQKELATVGEMLGRYEGRARRLLQTCLNDPLDCQQIDQFLVKVTRAVENIRLSLQGFARSYQRIARVVERQDSAALVTLCQQGSAGGEGSDEQQMMRQGFQQLEELLGEEQQPGQGEQQLPDELDELRNQLDEYIPQERDAEMVERIQERQQRRRQQAEEELHQPGYSFDKLLDELFLRFYGNVDGRQDE